MLWISKSTDRGSSNSSMLLSPNPVN